MPNRTKLSNIYNKIRKSPISAANSATQWATQTAIYTNILSWKNMHNIKAVLFGILSIKPYCTKIATATIIWLMAVILTIARPIVISAVTV